MSTFLLKYNKILYVYVVQWMCVFGSHPVKMCEHGTHQVQYEDFISVTGKGFLCILITDGYIPSEEQGTFRTAGLKSKV